MSDLGDLIAVLRTSIAEAGIGLDLADIIDEPEADVWNQIAATIATANKGVTLIIEEVQGRNPEPTRAGLSFVLTLTLTLVAEPNWHRTGASTTESVRGLLEDLWGHVHALKLPATAHAAYEIRIQGWGRVENSRGYIMRQTVAERLLTYR